MSRLSSELEEKLGSGVQPSTKLEWAMTWARKGLFVFPVHGGLGTPAIDCWYKHSTTNIAKIIEWWSQNPSYDAGCALDKSNHFAVIAVGDAGRASIAAIEARYTFEPDFRASTAWGNELMLFTGTAISNHEILGAGVHVRGAGRFVYLPLGQSRHVEEAPPGERAEQW